MAITFVRLGFVAVFDLEMLFVDSRFGGTARIGLRAGVLAFGFETLLRVVAFLIATFFFGAVVTRRAGFATLVLERKTGLGDFTF